MIRRIVSTPWTLKDVIIVLTVVFAGSYGLELLLRPLLTSVFSLAQRYLFAGLLQAFFFVGSVLTVILVRYKGNLKQVGLGRLFLPDQIRTGVVGGIALFLMVLISGFVISTAFSVQPRPQPFTDLLAKARTPFEVFVPFFIGGVLAPVGEEIYFRGFAYPVFRRRLGINGGIIFSALFFSALHFDLFRFIPIAVGGAGLAWLYENTESLVTPIVAHSVWNVAMLGLFFIANQIYI